MAKLTKQQAEVIRLNLRAFETNFGKARIERVPYSTQINVYYPEDSNTYIQNCPNIHYLNGWLYGCVQGALRGEFKTDGNRDGVTAES